MVLLKKATGLDKKLTELTAAYSQLVSYGVVVDSRMLALPDFLNLAQRSHLEWIKTLKDAVNIETKFTGNTDPSKGLIGTWLNSYSNSQHQVKSANNMANKHF